MTKYSAYLEWLDNQIDYYNKKILEMYPDSSYYLAKYSTLKEAKKMYLLICSDRNKKDIN